MTKKVVVTRLINQACIDKLKKDFKVVVWPEDETPMPRDQFLKETKDAHGVLTMLSDQVDEEMIAQSENLQVVSNLAVGYDNIDLNAAKKHNVTVTNTPEVLTETTAELAFTMMLMSARRTIEANQELMSGNWTGWSPYQMAGTDVYGKTVGIFGMGAIGAAFARRLKGFNCKVIYHNRSKSEHARAVDADYVSFDELLAQSDFILCAAPLTEETKHTFNKDVFKKMKSTAHFINIGRGGHVVESDLKDAIENEDIAAAALDVYDNEPIGKDHPFVGLKNMTLLPHIGSASVASRDKMMELCMNNILQVLNGGQPFTPVE
jgi:glyoxylate reductase